MPQPSKTLGIKEAISHSYNENQREELFLIFYHCITTSTLSQQAPKH